MPPSLTHKHTHSQICIPLETSFVLSIVPVHKIFPYTSLCTQIFLWAPQSLECPYGVLLFSLFCFVLGLQKVPNMSTQPHNPSIESLKMRTLKCPFYRCLPYVFIRAHPRTAVREFVLCLIEQDLLTGH